MTNPTDTTVTASAADQAATTAQLLTLVSEMRGLRDRAAQQRGKAVTFAEIAHASTAGRSTLSPSFHKFLQELAEILDNNRPQEADSELDKEWRGAVQAWMKSRT